MLPTSHPQQNQLLAALATVDFAPIEANLELIRLKVGQMLYEPGGQLQHA